MTQDPGMAPLHDPALTELREAYEKGDLILFAGAGVSAAAGLPSPRVFVPGRAMRADRIHCERADGDFAWEPIALDWKPPSS